MLRINPDKLNELIDALREMQRVSNMQTAAFGHIAPPAVDEPRLPYPTCEADVTPFIAERTRIWRETWITGQLEWIIEDLQKLKRP
jgi:hypothetical protein